MPMTRLQGQDWLGEGTNFLKLTMAKVPLRKLSVLLLFYSYKKKKYVYQQLPNVTKLINGSFSINTGTQVATSRTHTHFF